MSKKTNNKKIDKELDDFDSFKAKSSERDSQIHQLTSDLLDDNSSEESPTIDDSTNSIDNSGSNDLNKASDNTTNLAIVPDSDNLPDLNNSSDNFETDDFNYQDFNDSNKSINDFDLPDFSDTDNLTLDDNSNSINSAEKLRDKYRNHIRSLLIQDAVNKSKKQGITTDINPANQLSDPDKYQMSVYDESLYAKLSKHTHAAQENISSNYSRGCYIVEQYLTPRLFKRAEEGFDYYTIHIAELRDYLQERYVNVYKSPANHLYDYIDSIEFVKHFAKMKHLSIVGNIDVSDINVDYLIITWRH